MASRNEYMVVKKFEEEPEGYLLRNLGTGEGKKYSRIQVIFLIGRGQVKNMDAQFYNGKVLLRGKDINLKKLDKVQPVADDAKPASLNEKILEVVATIKRGRSSVGYVVKNTMTMEEKPFKRDVIIKMALKKQIVNVAVQRDNVNDTYILRGEGCRLSELPVIDADTLLQKR